MQESEVKKHVARLVLRNPYLNFKTKQQEGWSYLWIGRPPGSNVFKEAGALLGGTLEVSDFKGICTEAEITDPNYVPTAEQLRQASIQALLRELAEELGLDTYFIGVIAQALVTALVFEPRTDNGYTTHAFAVQVDEYISEITVKRDANERAGFLTYEQIIREHTAGLASLPGAVEYIIAAERYFNQDQDDDDPPLKLASYDDVE
jgi:hypothetical protein